MCRPTQTNSNTSLVLERLQQRLQEQLQLSGAPLNLCSADHLAHCASRGSGPRVFCGHVPPECTEELVKAHFSQWGHVLDVYFPKRKDTFRRRPFCFVTFNRLEDAQRAIAESPMNICGIPIKQLNLVEDRSDYYKHRHTAAQSALVQALQTLALLGPDAAASSGQSLDLNNLAALLSMEGAGAPQMGAPQMQMGAPQMGAPQMQMGAPQMQMGARPQPFPMGGMNGYDAPSPYAPGASLPFANLPGFSQAGLTAGQPAAGLAMPTAAPTYGAPSAPPAFPPASAAALAAALGGPGCRMGINTADWQLPTGARSPFSPLDMQHPSASSSPPRGDLPLAAVLPLIHGAGRPAPGMSGGSSSGTASPDLEAAAANRLAMWQLQSELLASDCCMGAAGRMS